MRIELSNVTFSYKKKLPQVLTGASCAFESGTISVLLGHNGCGKTTLGKIILGLIKPTGGQVLIDGADAKKLNAGKRAARIGYLFQNPDLQLFAPTVMEELTFPYELSKTLTDEKLAQLKELLAQFKLDGTEERFPLTMSGGEKQRLALATVMARSVEFLILDEPTSAVDSEGVKFIIDFVSGFAKNGGGVIVITHDEEFLDALPAPRLLTMEGGKIYEA